jgi:hypothetical protein
VIEMIVESGYGLLHKKSGHLVGVTTESGDGCDGVSVIHTLDHDSNLKWIVDKITASYVRMFSTEWYNARYDTPINPYEPEELDVVLIEVNAIVEDSVNVPTKEEYLNMRYNTKGRKYYDPCHYQYVMSEIKKYGRSFGYSLYDLKLLLGGD